MCAGPGAHVATQTSVLVVAEDGSSDPQGTGTGQAEYEAGQPADRNPWE